MKLFLLVALLSSGCIYGMDITKRTPEKSEPDKKTQTNKINKSNNDLPTDLYHDWPGGPTTSFLNVLQERHILPNSDEILPAHIIASIIVYQTNK